MKKLQKTPVVYLSLFLLMTASLFAETSSVDKKAVEKKIQDLEQTNSVLTDVITKNSNAIQTKKSEKKELLQLHQSGTKLRQKIESQIRTLNKDLENATTAETYKKLTAEKDNLSVNYKKVNAKVAAYSSRAEFLNFEIENLKKHIKILSSQKKINKENIAKLNRLLQKTSSSGSYEEHIETGKSIEKEVESFLNRDPGQKNAK